jgi:hypothetical protein
VHGDTAVRFDDRAAEALFAALEAGWEYETRPSSRGADMPTARPLRLPRCAKTALKTKTATVTFDVAGGAAGSGMA